MFVRNAWYVAAWSHEVAHAPLKRRILNEPVVLYRMRGGAAVALLDRCPHRLAPLSLGTIVDDQLQCAYHGLRFNESGRCTHIPGAERISEGAAVPSFPIADKWGCVWIWMGDPARADISSIPQTFRWLTEPGWHAVTGYCDMQAAYQLVIDNLLDLSHEAFLHPNTIGNAAVGEIPAQTRVDGDTVITSRKMPSCDVPPLFAQAYPFGGQIDRYQQVVFQGPASVCIDVKAVPAGATDVTGGLAWMVMQGITPRSECATSVFWAVSRPFAVDNEEVSENLRRGAARTLHEDQTMLEAQQRSAQDVDLDGRTVFTKGDLAPTYGRKVLQAMQKREAREQG